MVQIYLSEANADGAGGVITAVIDGTYPAPAATDTTVNVSVNNTTEFNLKIAHDVTTGLEITRTQLTGGTLGTATPNLEVGVVGGGVGFPTAPGATAPEQTNYMDRLAFAVTGAADNTPDVFTNTAEIKTQFAATFAGPALTAINTALGANQVAAAVEVAQAIFDETPERFKLFVPAGTLPAAHITAGDVGTGFTNTNSTDEIFLLQDDQWTLATNTTITESAGVAVTQAGSGGVGTLKVELTGSSVAQVVIQAVNGTTFNDTGTLTFTGTSATILGSAITGATNSAGGSDGKAIITIAAGGAVTAITMKVVGSSYNSTNDIKIAGTTVGGGGSLTIPAAALTPFRLALINSNDVLTTAVEIPVETDDSFIVRCTIDAPATQKEDDGVSTAVCDYSQNLKFVAA